MWQAITGDQVDPVTMNKSEVEELMLTRPPTAERLIDFEIIFLKVNFPQRGAPGEDSSPQEQWRPSRQVLGQEANLADSKKQ